MQLIRNNAVAMHYMDAAMAKRCVEILPGSVLREFGECSDHCVRPTKQQVLSERKLWNGRPSRASACLFPCPRSGGVVEWRTCLADDVGHGSRERPLSHLGGGNVWRRGCRRRVERDVAFLDVLRAVPEALHDGDRECGAGGGGGVGRAVSDMAVCAVAAPRLVLEAEDADACPGRKVGGHGAADGGAGEVKVHLSRRGRGDEACRQPGEDVRG